MDNIDPSQLNEEPSPEPTLQPVDVWRARVTDGWHRISRSSFARGAAFWALLVGVAYLVGTLAIAPMISEAAGLGSATYDVSPEVAKKDSRPEPTVLITPIVSNKPAPAPQAAAPPKEVSHKHHRRHRRHHTLPPDELYLGKSQDGGSEDGSEVRSRRHRGDDKKEGGGEDRGGRSRDSGGDDGVQPGQGIGDG